MKSLLNLYLVFRRPKNFLRGLFIFAFAWLSLHFLVGMDRDLGGINLILSLEAGIAGALIMMKQDSHSENMEKMIYAMLEMASAQKQTMLEHSEILKKIASRKEVKDAVD